MSTPNHSCQNTLLSSGKHFWNDPACQSGSAPPLKVGVKVRVPPKTVGGPKEMWGLLKKNLLATLAQVVLHTFKTVASPLAPMHLVKSLYCCYSNRKFLDFFFLGSVWQSSRLFSLKYTLCFTLSFLVWEL